jgi:hypothetical protein
MNFIVMQTKARPHNQLGLVISGKYTYWGGALDL